MGLIVMCLLAGAFSSQANNLLTGGGFENGHVGKKTDVLYRGGKYNDAVSIDDETNEIWIAARSPKYISTTNTAWTGQSGNLALILHNDVPTTALIGAFQIVDVSGLGKIIGKKVSFTYDLTRSSKAVAGGKNARYQVIGFKNTFRSSVKVDYFGTDAGFSGGGFDWIISDNEVSAEAMDIQHFQSFGSSNVVLSSDYDYIGVFLAASDVGDGGIVAIDNVQLTITKEP